MESMKQKFFRAAVPLVMLAVSAALSVFGYRLPQPVREPLPVLMYHHMVPDGQDCNDMTVTPGKFRSDLDTILAKGYTPVLPRELAAGESLPEKPILITFDDGYRSNYELLFPLLQAYQMKAVVSIMVYMQDVSADNFLSWDMCREMQASGLVEIASHTYALHNLEQNGDYFAKGVNGIQRKTGESSWQFQMRVLTDLKKSRDILQRELGTAPQLFAYPYGETEPDAEAYLRRLFPMTVITGGPLSSAAHFRLPGDAAGGSIVINGTMRPKIDTKKHQFPEPFAMQRVPGTGIGQGI